MDAAALRDLQAPLKQQYRDDPASACVSMHAEAAFADPGVTCTVQTWAGPARAGLHTSTGGDGSDACSGDMLLQALLACAGVTMRSVATSMGVEIRSARLTARGEMDADDATLAKLGQLTERYCVVARTLAQPPHLTVRRT
jgi:uncharacterized OsmC-like protein